MPRSYLMVVLVMPQQEYGARWSLKTAEGVLKLRAIRSSGDWEQYREFYKKRDWGRNHR